MPNEDRPHFRILPKHIRREKIEPTAFGQIFERPDFGQHGIALKSGIRRTREAIGHFQDTTASDSLFIQVKTPESRPVRQEAKKLSQLGLNVVSYSQRSPNLATAKISEENLQHLERRIDRYARESNHPGKSYISVIESFDFVPVEEKLSPTIESFPEGQVFESIVYFYSGLSEREIKGIVTAMQDYLLERDAELLDVHTFSTGDTTAVVKTSLNVLRELGRDFNTLRQIGPDRAFFVTDSTRIGRMPNPLAVNAPLCQTTVAVVDSGIQPTCQLFSTALTGNLSFLPSNAVAPHYDHGTFVASRILYGDSIEATLQNQPVTPACHVLDVQVIGKSSNGEMVGLDEQELAKAIDSAVQSFSKRVRVVNISLGNDEAIRDNEYSLVAQIVDQKARDSDILFVVTAGNIRDPRLVASFPSNINNPVWRVDLPGEALLAITVGSIAKYVDTQALSRIDEVSPFSRVGPGSDGGVKPEVVSHGGNCLQTGLPTVRIAVQGAHGNGTDLAFDIGTSFAAPLISRIAAELFDHYGSPSANLIKALICHFTNPAIAPDVSATPLMTTGFGIPNSEMAKSSGMHRAAYICEGTIDRNSYHYVPFFVPSALAPGASRAQFRIRGTLCYDPPVDPSNPREYSCARISLSLMKKTASGDREISLSNDFIWSNAWNPIAKFDKRFSRSFASGEWEMRLRLWTRGLPDNHKQRYSLIIELIDDSSTIDIWSEIVSEAGAKFVRLSRQVAA